MRNPLLLLSALALAGCGGLTAPVEQADPCAKPVLLPERWLNDAEVEALWRRDRVALLDCGMRVEVLSGRAVE